MTSKTRKAVIGAVGAGALAAVLVLQAGPGNAKPSAPKASVGFQDHGERDLAQVLLRSLIKYPDFSNVRVVPTGIEVSTVGQPADQLRADVEAAVNAAPAHIEVKFRRVANSHDELRRTQDQLEASISRWSARGVEISSDGISAASNTILVTLSDYTPAAAESLMTFYAGKVSVEASSRSFATS